MTHPWALGVMIVVALLVSTLGWMIVEEFRGPRPAKVYDYYEEWLKRADLERQLNDSKSRDSSRNVGGQSATENNA